MPAFIKYVIIATLLQSSAVMGEDDLQTTKEQPQLIYSQKLIALIPQSRDQLIAYSMTTNTWSKIQIPVEADLRARLTVSPAMAACQLGQSIFAYSSIAGRWAELKIPKDSKTRFEVGNDSVNAVTKSDSINQLYVFGANTGAWTGVDLKTGKILDVDQLNQDHSN